jgi:NAD(P)-dependent dehydrogenase (short-subunit alcohol dehydrogenase family)
MTVKHSKKTMLITGGSRGIGAAVAIIAAQRGYSVAVKLPPKWLSKLKS